MSAEQFVRGKLQFKKQQKPIIIDAKKMTYKISQKLILKRKKQDQDVQDQILENFQTDNLEDQQEQIKSESEPKELDEEQIRAIREKEEILNPDRIVKKLKVGKTPAQVSFDMIKMKRIEDRIAKQLELTYREKVDDFNRKIAKMPEHYDIPKVGPG